MSFETERNLVTEMPFEKCNVGNPVDAAGIVDDALQEIWFSSPMLNYDELVENVTHATPYKPEEVSRVVDHMLNYDTPIIQKDEQDKMVFSAVGRGCIETSRIFNDELDPLDCTYLYISAQAKGFFKEFDAPKNSPIEHVGEVVEELDNDPAVQAKLNVLTKRAEIRGILRAQARRIGLIPQGDRYKRFRTRFK